MGTRTHGRIEHHLETALETTTHRDTTYHLREALQLLQVEKRRADPVSVDPL